MSWKTAYRSFYYQDAPEPEDIVLAAAETALLVIDIQNTYMEPKPDSAEDARWQPFFERMRGTVIPNTARLIEICRARGVQPVFARVACHKLDGRDRSLSQKKPGFNYLLLPKSREDSQIVPELAPQRDEIVITKTTDSALTGTNLRLILHNMGIKRRRGRHLHRPVRVLHGPQPRRRELQRGGGRGLLRRRDYGPSSQGARDHQHDLLPRHLARRGDGVLW